MSKVEYKPKGYQNVIPYLVVKDPRATIEFAEKVLKGTTIEKIEDAQGNLNHAEVRVGDCVIMIGQSREQWQPIPAMLYVYIPDCDEAYERAIKLGAQSEMAPSDQFYGDRNAGVRDANGTSWWFATRKEEVSPEELQRRAQARG